MTQPVVLPGGHTKHSGIYRLTAKGSETHELRTKHNTDSWRIVRLILSTYGRADFWDIAVAVRPHKHGGISKPHAGPQSFIRYLSRMGLIEKVPS